MSWKQPYCRNVKLRVAEKQTKLTCTVLIASQKARSLLAHLQGTLHSSSVPTQPWNKIRVHYCSLSCFFSVTCLCMRNTYLWPVLPLRDHLVPVGNINSYMPEDFCVWTKCWIEVCIHPSVLCDLYTRKRDVSLNTNVWEKKKKKEKSSVPFFLFACLTLA